MVFDIKFGNLYELCITLGAYIIIGSFLVLFKKYNNQKDKLEWERFAVLVFSFGMVLLALGFIGYIIYIKYKAPYEDWFLIVYFIISIYIIKKYALNYGR